MAEKTRRQQDMVSSAYSSYAEATSDYSAYFNGSEAPLYITYYMIDDAASKVDTTLNDVHEEVGQHSPVRYTRIRHVPVYSLQTPMDIQTQLAENGLSSAIGGSFVMLPSLNLHPRPGEFFTIEYDIDPELSQHLFAIKDVQYDRATSPTKKFYQCTYALYPNDADEVYKQVIRKMVYMVGGKGNTEGVGDSYLITEDDYEISQKLQAAVDELIDKYTNMYFNEGMNTFTYQKSLDDSGNNFEYLWTPYLCHFIFKNDIITKSSTDFLTEIYVEDVNEDDFPYVYAENGYRKSIFYAIEKDNPSILNYTGAGFMETSVYDLNKPLSLPFFSTAAKYVLVDISRKFNDNIKFWPFAFNWLLGDEDKIMVNVPDSQKFVGDITSCLVSDASGNLVPDTAHQSWNNLAEGSLLYQVASDNDKFTVSNSYCITQNGLASANLYDVLYTDTLTNYSDKDNYLFLKIVHDYFSGTFERNYLSIDAVSSTDFTTKLDKFLDDLEDVYVENNFMNFILIPIVIYILKKYE